MQTDALERADTAPQGQSERLSWGVITLQVTDLDRAVDFWTSVLGLQTRTHNNEQAELGTQKATLFVLQAGATVPVSPPYAGMYHLAIGMPTQAEFSRIFLRLVTMEVPVSPVDHLGAKSFYLKDPDGLEIEITFETPERFGRMGDFSKGEMMFDINGNPHSGREALDVPAELAIAKGADIFAPLTDETKLSHMHFKVPDLAAAAAWFEGIGFGPNIMLPNWGFCDMNAGTPHVHRLAMNVWAGTNRPAAPSNMARLTHYELIANDPAVMTVAKGLMPSDTGLKGRDPSGIALSLIPAATT